MSSSRHRPPGFGARTRERSRRAGARERYRALTKLDIREAQGGAIASPQPAFDSSDATAPAPSLMERVRALYEDSAVPVAEIARLVEVSERTLYKYVARGGWRRRYAGPAHDADGVAKKFAPVTGAGGRFIRRDQAGQPQTSGLKALDPQGAGRVTEACAQAGAVSDAAQAEVREQAARRAAAQTFAVRLHTLDVLNDTLAELAKTLKVATPMAEAPKPHRPANHRARGGRGRLETFAMRAGLGAARHAAAPAVRNVPRNPRAERLAAHIKAAIIRQIEAVLTLA